jgi:hypothetical protein
MLPWVRQQLRIQIGSTTLNSRLRISISLSPKGRNTWGFSCTTRTHSRRLSLAIILFPCSEKYRYWWDGNWKWWENLVLTCLTRSRASRSICLRKESSFEIIECNDLGFYVLANSLQPVCLLVNTIAVLCREISTAFNTFIYVQEKRA